MNYAIYNPTTNHILSVVTEPSGKLPDGYEFRLEDKVPSDATRETITVTQQVWEAKEFLDRFTMAELMAISIAARTDAMLDVMFRKLTATTEVHADNTELLQGLGYLVSLGLLTSERRSALLA